MKSKASLLATTWGSHWPGYDSGSCSFLSFFFICAPGTNQSKTQPAVWAAATSSCSSDFRSTPFNDKNRVGRCVRMRFRKHPAMISLGSGT